MSGGQTGMKLRMIYLGAVAIVLMLIVWYGSAREAAEAVDPPGGPSEKTTVWIATDPHYLAPELTDHGAYFQQVIENADGKVTAYSEELLEAFVEEVIAQAPDALILPGDLTFNGARQSHVNLAVKLRRIADAGISVLVLPGNHDLESIMAAVFQGDGFQRTDNITADEFAEIYGAFLDKTALTRDPHSLSYVAELTPELRVLLVDVNTVDTPGQLTDLTLNWVEQQLCDAAENGARVLAVSHQNLLQHNGIFSFGFVIGNSAKLLALYEKHGVLCNLSGHMHIQHSEVSDNGFLEIAGSSLAVSPNQYGILTFDGTQADYKTQTVNVSAWAKERKLTDEALLHFEQYSHDFFAKTACRQIENELAGSENASRLADFYAKANTAYFAGRMDAMDWDSAVYEQWQKRPSLTAFYLKTIMEEVGQNHTRLSFDF